MQEDAGEEVDITQDHDLYLKKKGSQSIQEFERKFKEHIKANLKEEHPYSLDNKLEVIISISMTNKRLSEVDVDNLIKSVLDCFNGLVYIDDSQVVNVLGTKDVNEFAPLNSIFVGIRKLNNRASWFEDIKLAYFEYEE